MSDPNMCIECENPISECVCEDDWEEEYPEEDEEIEPEYELPNKVLGDGTFE